MHALLIIVKKNLQQLSIKSDRYFHGSRYRHMNLDIDMGVDFVKLRKNQRSHLATGSRLFNRLPLSRIEN